MSSYGLIYSKACYLLVELEYKVLSVIKFLKFKLEITGEQQRLELYELDEIRMDAYESAKTYKEKTKAFHGKVIMFKSFTPGQKVLLYNPRLHLLLES